ncbi:MAG: hypothetical protein N2378_15375 [Chloroflexaceae bacterium]|nr:hypothetical protein [Chloroflexaceae bacterium]
MSLLWGICGEGRRIAKDIPGLLALLAAWRIADGPVGSAASGPVQPEPGLLARAEAILRQRSAQFFAAGVIQPATLQTIGWTLEGLVEEAEDADGATRDNGRVRDLSIVRDLVALLRAALESGDDRRT